MPYLSAPCVYRLYPARWRATRLAGGTIWLLSAGEWGGIEMLGGIGGWADRCLDDANVLPLLDLDYELKQRQ